MNFVHYNADVVHSIEFLGRVRNVCACVHAKYGSVWMSSSLPCFWSRQYVVLPMYPMPLHGRDSIQNKMPSYDFKNNNAHHLMPSHICLILDLHCQGCGAPDAMEE